VNPANRSMFELLRQSTVSFSHGTGLMGMLVSTDKLDCFGKERDA